MSTEYYSVPEATHAQTCLPTRVSLHPRRRYFFLAAGFPRSQLSWSPTSPSSCGLSTFLISLGSLSCFKPLLLLQQGLSTSMFLGTVSSVTGHSSMELWHENFQLVQVFNNLAHHIHEFIFAGFPREIFKQGSRHETQCNTLFHTG